MMRNFGVQPRIAWQIDPFGHSKLTPSLFKLMGYDALVINRIHHRFKGSLRNSRDMEFFWNGSQTGCEPDCSMFTHVLYNHYSAPRGFDWEESWSAGPEINPSNIEFQAQALISVFRVCSFAFFSALIRIFTGTCQCL
jgi:hypothetical protein